jgi:ATP-binding cassette subfamily F protein 3
MIKTNDLEISFSGQKIFSDVNIIINKKEKVGFIGRNGSGKSTFLKIIIGKLEQDSGEVMMPKGYKIGHLDQHIKFTEQTVIDEVCSVLSGDREYETWKGESILTGLGFSYDEMSKNPNDFSGGNQVKINLAKLLLDEPDMFCLMSQQTI